MLLVDGKLYDMSHWYDHLRSFDDMSCMLFMSCHVMSLLMYASISRFSQGTSADREIQRTLMEVCLIVPISAT